MQNYQWKLWWEILIFATVIIYIMLVHDLLSDLQFLNLVRLAEMVLVNWQRNKPQSTQLFGMAR